MTTIEKDSKGSYLNSNVWILIDIGRKTDYRGRVHANDMYHGYEIAVFVSETDQPLEMREEIFLLPTSLYTEVKKTRGKDALGKPLTIQINGDVYTTQKDKYVKIFVKVG